MILKVLLVVVVIGIVYFMFIKKKPTTLAQNEKKQKKKDNLKTNDMVECKECGVFVEVGEAKMNGASYYCSSECLDKAN